MTRKRCAALLLFCAGTAGAQPCFLLPDNFITRQNDAFICRLYEGNDLRKEIPVRRDMDSSYHWYNLIGGQDLRGRDPDGTLPLLQDHANVEGLQLVTLDLSGDTKTISGANFKQLARLSVYNDALKKTLYVAGRHKAVRVRFSNYLKALAMTGTASGSLYFKEVQQRLEIMLLDNPYPPSVGKNISVQIKFDGKPLPSASVEILRKTGERFISVQTIKTSAEGKLRFKVDKAGTWMLRVTRLRPSTIAASDWDCFTASYTFGTSGAP